MQTGTRHLLNRQLFILNHGRAVLLTLSIMAFFVDRVRLSLAIHILYIKEEEERSMFHNVYI